MFDLGWGELLVVGVVALVVLGPKELPNALRTVSNLTKTARKLAGEFQSGINEIVREAELEDARKAAQSISKGSISQAIEKAVDPTGEMKSAVTSVENDAKAAAPVSPVGPIPPAPAIAATPSANPPIAAPEPAKSEDAAENEPAKVEAEAKA
ncbi:MAG TPA: Sec-independent protein translocase protein TatB [Dongiaceae bacterium]|jgi:sec-independent protein translocase protein TatB|nr:Sec-independent protein translocase protein TatB [Dongiaceae bacterium]